MRAKRGDIYIISNHNRTVLYIGVTANLSARIEEHKSEIGGKFAKAYRCIDLIYYEIFDDIESAIEREKQLKNWHRQWKFNLIKSKNSTLKDLYDEVLECD